MKPLPNMRKSDHGLKDLIALLPPKCSMIEIGCYRGESTQIFLNSGKIEKIYCIDPWLNGYDNSDIASYHSPMSEVEKEFDQKFLCDDRVFKIKKFSECAVFDIKNLVDFVYIDGNHQYESVKQDIVLYRGTIKNGGYIGGHDFGFPSCPGVLPAVMEILGKPDHVFSDTSWLRKV